MYSRDVQEEPDMYAFKQSKHLSGTPTVNLRVASEDCATVQSAIRRPALLPGPASFSVGGHG